MRLVGKREQNGFTIVELLIVIVVIAILASITVVGYGGLRNRANDAAVQSNLRGMGGQIQQFIINESKLPTTIADLTSIGMKVSGAAYGNHYVASGLNYNMAYCYSAATSDFILVAASRSGNLFVYDDGVKSGTGTMATIATTCTNNGLTTATYAWFHSGSAWQYGIES